MNSETSSNDAPATGGRSWPLLVVASVVFLRLVVGWHFFAEGVKKLDYDPGTQTTEISSEFKAQTEGFLRGAKGPLADFYASQLPGFHKWQTLLAKPKLWETLSEDEKLQREAWFAEYNARRGKAETAQKKDPEAEPPPIEFPPFAPYADWGKQIADDWRRTLEAFTATDGLTDEQRAAAADLYLQAHKQLTDYLLDETVEIEQYQHELWRLQQIESGPGGEEVPFLIDRSAAKEAELRAKPLQWVADVRELENHYYNELQGLLTEDQREDNPELTGEVRETLVDAAEQRFDWVNFGVAALTIGVGALLIVGLFTRLASIGGCLFLLMVMSTQPPWVADAMPIYNQMVEFAALTVLFATAAGRWAGLDFFLYALVGKRPR